METMDNIRPNLLKACNKELATSLTHIANFVSGNYPDQLKIARVIPLFKKWELHLTKNYRPISLFSSLLLWSLVWILCWQLGDGAAM